MTEIIRVGMLCNWCEPRALCELFNRMTTDGNYEWVDEQGCRIRMVADDPTPDYWVVINRPRPQDERLLDPVRTIVFQMEPEMWTARMRPLWERWASPSPTSFLQVRDHRRYRNSCDWWVGLRHRELMDSALPAKTRQLAACVSEKYTDPGHVRRVELLRYLDAQDIDLDIYGYRGHGFRRWRGKTPLHDKRAAMLPYRYYVDAENHATPNFFTEKIVDCLLAETLCFYWGCPNLEAFFDPRAFIRLEMDDFERDLERIREAIARNEWQRRLPYIRSEKRRVLEDYAFFPTLARVLDGERRPRISTAPGTAARQLAEIIGSRRCGVFVEVSDRAGDPRVSETLDAERGLRWSGVCIESDLQRAFAARSLRDSTVLVDDGMSALHDQLEQNAVPPNAIDWLNLAVSSPSARLAPGGRIDPSRVRADVVTFPLAGTAERRQCLALLSLHGYEPYAPHGEPVAATRTARDHIFGFYHLCTINGWQGVLDEQLDSWRRSELAIASRRIFASVVGPRYRAGASLLKAALGDRIEIVHAGEDASTFERPALEFCRRFCVETEPRAAGVWYVHSKGVSDRHRANPHIVDWRHLMQHFVVERWRDCVAAIREHDICGVNWRERPSPHFSGNFWWASPRYIGTLPESIGEGHFQPERWIGGSMPSVCCLHDSELDHHLAPYPATAYA